MLSGCSENTGQRWWFTVWKWSHISDPRNRLEIPLLTRQTDRQTASQTAMQAVPVSPAAAQGCSSALHITLRSQPLHCTGLCLSRRECILQMVEICHF